MSLQQHLENTCPSSRGILVRSYQHSPNSSQICSKSCPSSYTKIVCSNKLWSHLCTLREYCCDTYCIPLLPNTYAPFMRLCKSPVPLYKLWTSHGLLHPSHINFFGDLYFPRDFHLPRDVPHPGMNVVIHECCPIIRQVMKI